MIPKILSILLTLVLTLNHELSAQQPQPKLNQISGLPKLEIKREKTPLFSEKPTLREDGLMLAKLIVPPYLFHPTNTVDDPFSSNEGPPRKKMTAREQLELLGISFSAEKARAIYNPASSQLILVNTQEEIQKVASYVESVTTAMVKNTHLRIEIYEVPTLLGLDAASSAEAHLNHKPERDALLSLARQGKARVVDMLNAVSRPGERTQLQNTTEVYGVKGFRATTSDKETAQTSIVPQIEKMYYGSHLQFETLLNSNEVTIDLSFSFEFDTAPPSAIKSQLPIKGTDQFREAEVLHFHKKRITTSITLREKHWQLVGSWKPTGKGYEKTDLIHLVFLEVRTTPPPKLEGTIPNAQKAK